jgi:myo-inositol 2-dehydrogenase/D-chiro-inositol 1-dehydrogenase
VTVRVGVIGTGVMGADHVRTLVSSVARAQLVAVCDADGDRARVVAANAPGCRVETDPEGLIGAPDVDAVLVASPDDSHAGFVVLCLQHGKPVLCEKPLAITSDECLRIIEAEASGARRLIQLGFMRRYDPGYLAIKDELLAGAIGLPLMLHCVHRNAHSTAGYTDDMILTNSTVHEIDITRWLLSEEIASVSVHSPRPSSLVPPGFADPQFTLLRSQSGVLAGIETFVNASYGYDIRCEVVAERGTVSLRPTEAVSIRSDRRDAVSVPSDWRVRFAEAYRLELQDWVDGAAADAARGPSAWDGYAASVVAEAGLASRDSRQEVQVALADRPGIYGPVAN